MCGRFTITIALGWRDWFHVQEDSPPIPSRYTVAPSQAVPVIVRESSSKLVMMQWGLVPCLKIKHGRHHPTVKQQI